MFSRSKSSAPSSKTSSMCKSSAPPSMSCTCKSTTSSKTNSLCKYCTYLSKTNSKSSAPSAKRYHCSIRFRECKSCQSSKTNPCKHCKVSFSPAPTSTCQSAGSQSSGSASRLSTTARAGSFGQTSQTRSKAPSTEYMYIDARGGTGSCYNNDSSLTKRFSNLSLEQHASMDRSGSSRCPPTQGRPPSSVQYLYQDCQGGGIGLPYNPNYNVYGRHPNLSPAQHAAVDAAETFERWISPYN